MSVRVVYKRKDNSKYHMIFKSNSNDAQDIEELIKHKINYFNKLQSNWPDVVVEKEEIV